MSTYKILYYLSTCPACGKQGREKEMPILYGHRRYCADCLPAARKAHACTCVLCGDVFYDREPGPGVCHTCLWSDPDIGQEERRLPVHMRRASKAGKPATLTLDEWVHTLTDFNGKCAYCLEADFTVLEHYLPVERAGTTASNCIPACQSCNIRKRQDRAGGIPKADLERVRRYLVNRSRTSPSGVATLEIRHSKTLATGGQPVTSA